MKGSAQGSEDVLKEIPISPEKPPQVPSSSALLFWGAFSRDSTQRSAHQKGGAPEGNNDRKREWS